MKDQAYRIIFEGKIAEGVDSQTARSNLQRLLKVDDATIERLFSGKRVVLKKDATAATVEKYHLALTRAGVHYSTDPEISSEAEAHSARDSVNSPGRKNLTLQPIPQPPGTPSSEAAVNPYAPPTQDPVINKQVFCRSCGSKIDETASECPACKTRQIVGKPKSKIVAGLLAIFLGFLGAHRFYLGQWIGLIYLLFGLLAWAVALVEGIVFLLTPQERWDRKYGNVVTNSGAAMIVVAVVVFVAIIGILAAIAIPQYAEYTQRASVAQAEASIQPSLRKIEDFAERNGYLPNDNLEAGVDVAISTQHIESLVISANGVLTITLSAKEGNPIASQTLLWIPSLQGGSLRWDCSGGSLPARFRSKDCRSGKYSGQQELTPNQWAIADDGVSKIRVPRNWNRLPELNDVASLQYGLPRQEQYVIVISEPRADFSAGMDLYSYNDSIMEQYFMTAIDNVNIKLLGDIDLNGLKGVKYEIRGSVNNVNIVYLYTALEGKDHFHQVLFWTLPTKWSEAQPIYESALSSFTEN